MEKVKTLFVFDFDHTLIDDNSDTWIMSLCPELELLKNLGSMRKDFNCWTRLMDHTFSLIHEQGRTKEEIMEHMKKVQLFEQALQATRAVHECNDTDSIIISDSNMLFIDTILEASGAKGLFDSIISNPAWFEESGRLHVQEYHSHTCPDCKRTPNLCKGQALLEYRQQQRGRGEGYRRVVYVGDGKNDLCPCLKLGKEDIVVCREGYALAEQLKLSSSCCAKVHTLDFVSSLGDFVTSSLL